MKEKFETQFEKIVGGTEKEKTEARRMFQKILEDPQNIPEKYKRHEIQKTKEDEGLISRIESGVYEMARAYGASPKFMPPGNVHILPREKMRNRGRHLLFQQQILIGKGAHELPFLKTMVHEFFHKASYKSAQIFPERKFGNFFRKTTGFDLKRSGLNIVERSPGGEPTPTYFDDAEEAVVEFVSEKFLDKNLRYDEKYKKSFEDMDKIKEWLARFPEMFPGAVEMNRNILMNLPYIYAIEGGGNIVKMLEGGENNNYKLGYLQAALERADDEGRFVRSHLVEEQEMFNHMLDELVEKKVFRDRKEAFDAFARANFSGNFLPLARFVESVLGSGAFRKIAEIFKKEPHKKESFAGNIVKVLKFGMDRLK